jgi:hypothetical protein
MMITNSSMYLPITIQSPNDSEGGGSRISIRGPARKEKSRMKNDTISVDSDTKINRTIGSEDSRNFSPDTKKSMKSNDSRPSPSRAFESKPGLPKIDKKASPFAKVKKTGAKRQMEVHLEQAGDYPALN